jgi:hypothetical protein
MTGPFNVDPNDVDSVAAQWDALREQFDRPAPNLTGNGPESQAARAAVAEAAARTAKLQADIGGTAATAKAGASVYTRQEGASSAKLGDATSPMSDIAGLFGTVGGLIEPLATEATSFGGQMLSTGSSLGTSLASLARGNTSTPSPGAGIGLPPADQDQHSPDQHVDTTSAAPEAREQHSEPAQTASEAR